MVSGGLRREKRGGWLGGVPPSSTSSHDRATPRLGFRGWGLRGREHIQDTLIVRMTEIGCVLLPSP